VKISAFVILPVYVAQTFKLFEKHGVEAELTDRLCQKRTSEAGHP